MLACRLGLEIGFLKATNGRVPFMHSQSEPNGAFIAVLLHIRPEMGLPARKPPGAQPVGGERPLPRAIWLRFWPELFVSRFGQSLIVGG
jgi:hypothetical protein